ncbi:hypothetical protein ASD00_27280 [Ensifer sp. Root31]|uniref:hypothetical protein n=1 Tax=Ensifer sp. Root31 TaxID=1736512 RepID=UPI00070B1F9F|nr:hypothetical protein [Ensifer sp. Root31]KQU89544.1 hypothetical protein ASD00_27280 [Ensifer sp. Root31]
MSDDKRTGFLAVSKNFGDAAAELLAGLGRFKILVVEARGRGLFLVLAEGAFLKAVVDLNHKALSLNEQFGGPNGTRKRGGDDPRDGQSLDDWLGRESLLFTRGVQMGVNLALGETFDVPIGLTMANEEEVLKTVGDTVDCVAPVFGAVDVAVGSHFAAWGKRRVKVFLVKVLKAEVDVDELEAVFVGGELTVEAGMVALYNVGFRSRVNTVRRERPKAPK